MGCDGPSKKEHVFTINGQEMRTRTCPRKLARPAYKYFRIKKWANDGNLGYLYGEEELPAKVMEALDVIDNANSEITNARREK